MVKETITKRSEDYSQWYLDVVEAAELAEHAPVKGCMVIKPYGYAIWEKIQRILDDSFKETGVENAYFPLFIPQGFLTKEAEHVEGFAPECAVVTQAGGKKLEEPLVVRPTSETVIYDVFSRWIKSYRDLPLLINQWANVVRWEMRPRLFLRTTEFLWQEGHTAHTTEEEADDKAKEMLGIYEAFAQDYLALPVISGTKTESEKFAGAQRTYCIEGMMQDGKALQAGTSHLLGQNFAKAFDVKFLDKEGKEQFVWQTSWGVSTRLIGALIMAHSDDKGLVLPPKIAPIQVVIVPVWTTKEEGESVLAKASELAEALRSKGISVKVDNREMRPGPRFYEWEKKGVPVRLEIGPRDIERKEAVIVRRDTGEKEIVAEDRVVDRVEKLLDDLQKSLFDRALSFRENNTRRCDSYDEFKKTIGEKDGFVLAHWCGEVDCEAKIKEATKATIRCIPFDRKAEAGKCLVCGKSSAARVVMSKAY